MSTDSVSDPAVLANLSHHSCMTIGEWLKLAELLRDWRPKQAEIGAVSPELNRNLQPFGNLSQQPFPSPARCDRQVLRPARQPSIFRQDDLKVGGWVTADWTLIDA